MKLSKLFVASIVLSIGLLFVSGCSAVQEQNVEDKTVIKVGVISPLTGPGVYIGEQYTNGVKLAVEKFNQTNSTKQIELFIEDSKTSPKDGVFAFQKLENTSKPDIYFSNLSAVSMALMPLAHENKVPVLASITVAPTLTTQGDYVFRYYPTTKEELTEIVKILEYKDTKKLGLLYLNDDFGNAILKETTDSVGNVIEIVSDNYERTEKDFGTQVLKLLAEKPDTIFMAGLESHLINISKKVQELGFEGTMVGISTMGLPAMEESLHSFVGEVYAPIPDLHNPKNEKAQYFLDSYKKAYSETPSHYAAVGYDVIQFLDSVLNGVDGISRESIKNALGEKKAYSGLFGPVAPYDNEFPYMLQAARWNAGTWEYLDL